jgi:hypothetical protein
MKLSEHLTASELRQYEEQTAPSATLLSWDDHLAECPDCRAGLASNDGLAKWADGLGEGGDGHLSYEQLAARAEKRTSADEEFAVAAHLLRCKACSEELADLVGFRGSLLPGQDSRRKRLPYLWIAAAMLVGVISVSLMTRRGPAVSTSKPAIGIPADWPAEDRALVEEALHAGRLPVGDAPADVRSKKGTLLGSATQALFTPLSPIGAMVESDRPEFRWQQLPGATSYRVEVYDSDFRLVIKSPEVARDDWEPPHSLDRSKLYHWQVVASRKGESITAPAPPAPDAEFRVLDAAAEQRIERARQDVPMGHLLAAVLLSRDGMKAEAAKELEKLPPDIRKAIRY